MRVAVLGGTGFAGQNVRDALEGAGMTVGAFSRTTGCGLMDLPMTWARLDAFRPDYIVNCDALVGSVNYVTDFAADVVDVNMRIIMNTYEAAQQLPEVIIINPLANCAYPGVVDQCHERGLWDGPIHPFQDGSPKKVVDDTYFRQRFPDFTSTPIEAGITKTVEYYRGLL